MSEINWDEAPEGATHYRNDLFYKVDDIGKWASVYAKEKQKWMTSAFISNKDLSNMSFKVKPNELDDMGGRALIFTMEPNKYDRKLKGVTVDVYDVLKAFGVTCPALQHLIKKALCVGIRGHKNTAQDLQDIIDSAQRAMELYDE